MPLIVLEGVDGAGKTTFAEELISLAPDPEDTLLLHRGQPKQYSIMQQYEDELLKVYDPRDSEQLVVCDRWHLGELVYGPLYRGQSRLTGGQARHIEMVLDSLGAVRVVLSPTLSTIKARLEERGEDFLKPEHVALVHDQFHTYGEMHGWDIADEPNALTVYHTAVARQNGVRHIHGVKRANYIGQSSPTYVIVTTRRHDIPMQPNMYEEAAFMSTLEVHNVPRSVGILQIHDTLALKKALKALNEPRVITIDHTARRLCDIANIQVASRYDTIAGLLYRETL